ncbi:MAG: T9SS type A sorting domain-containing protein [bacterium]|nr:T9SS type A sorting domain-containing protein [bacterium]
MKITFIKISLIACVAQLSYQANAQVIFTSGTEKKLITGLPNIYEETAIPFIYRGGKVIDLKWKRLSDSFPTEWFVMACMNGTCLNGVPENGVFENILNNPDSIGFLRYHFDFNGKAGQGIIKYLVFKDFIFSKSDTAIFNITYDPTLSSINTLLSNSYSIFPNPVIDNKISINLEESELISDLKITVYNCLGQTVVEYMLNPKSNIIEIELPIFSKGFYFVKMQFNGRQYISKIIK